MVTAEPVDARPGRGRSLHRRIGPLITGSATATQTAVQRRPPATWAGSGLLRRVIPTSGMPRRVVRRTRCTTASWHRARWPVHPIACDLRRSGTEPFGPTGV